jgi:hypothetical protein
MDALDATASLRFDRGLWHGEVPSRYGAIELVLAGTAEAPDDGHLAAIQAFMPHAVETIERLRRRLPLSFLWRPVRLTANRENQVGVQFQRRIFERRALLMATPLET